MPTRKNISKTGKIPFGDSVISQGLFDQILNASVDLMLRGGVVTDRRQAFSLILETIYKLDDAEYQKKFNRLYDRISNMKFSCVGGMVAASFQRMNEYKTIYNRFLCKTDRYLNLN